jgi:hypothetical protein
MLLQQLLVPGIPVNGKSIADRGRKLVCGLLGACGMAHDMVVAAK